MWTRLLLRSLKWKCFNIGLKKTRWGTCIDTYTIFVQNLLRVLTQLNTNNQASTPKRVKFEKIRKTHAKLFHIRVISSLLYQSTQKRNYCAKLRKFGPNMKAILSHSADSIFMTHHFAASIYLLVFCVGVIKAGLWLQTILT